MKFATTQHLLFLISLFTTVLLCVGDRECDAQWRLRNRPPAQSQYRWQSPTGFQVQPQRYYRPSSATPYRPDRSSYRQDAAATDSPANPNNGDGSPNYSSNTASRSSGADDADDADDAVQPRRPGDVKYLKQDLPPITKFPRIAADFEPQRAILISVCELLPTHQNVFLQIIQACQGHIEVGVLVNDKEQLVQAVRVLMKENRDYPHVKFYHLDLDTIWLRDFGPRIAELETGSVAFDFLYEGTRPRDEKMPKSWTDLTGQRYHAVPWTMQGGNLLFNGQGIALTTQRIFDDNHIRFQDPLPGTDPEVERREMVINEFRKECNLSQIVVLEPLRNEATRHVDMFAAFVAEDHVLVSQLKRSDDPVNAAVLDRNAAQLRKVKLADGRPMKVTRIPTPAREGKYWSTFTNVIFANDLILLPAFSSDDNRFVERAVAVYKTVLPDHQVIVVDTSSLKKLEGSVHCMSINVPQFADLPPRYLSLQKASDYVRKIDQRNISVKTK